LEKTIANDRFELKNYRNTLVFDDKIVVSTNFYQSTEHFLTRQKSSRRDRITLKDDIHKIKYNSIGNTVTIYFKRKKRKLIFHSNKTRNEFLAALNPDDFLTKTETKKVPTSKIASVLFVFTVLMVILFYYANLAKVLAVERFLFLVLGLVVGVYTLLKKTLNSLNVEYKDEV